MYFYNKCTNGRQRLSSWRKNMKLSLSLVCCLFVIAGVASGEQKLHSDAGRRPWSANKTTSLDARSYRPAHQQKWREAPTYHTRTSTSSSSSSSSSKDGAVPTSLHAPAPSTKKAQQIHRAPVNNSLRELMQLDSAGDASKANNNNNNNNGKKKRAEGDNDDDEDKKTLSQQIADGKYGLIQKEIYPKPPLRPGVISYATNPEVPRDTVKNLGGLDAEEIWLAEDHVLVLRGGWFPNHMNRTEVNAVWPPIDNYQAPPRQVKLPSKPKVPPPFPVQLKDGGPTLFIGPNGTKSNYPFPPPFFPFPPGDGFYPPPPGNESLYPPPQYPFPPPGNETYPLPPPPPGSYPQQGPPDPGQFPYPPPPHGYMPFPNGTSPYGPLPPFFPPLPPGAAFLPPPGNQTEFDEDDPSIYYPPPYDFFYPQDNTTSVPPGPLVPGIILPPPPNFFAPLNDDKPRGGVRRPTSTPLPHVPLGPTTAAPKPKPISQYYPVPSPRPIVVPQATPRPTTPYTTPPTFYYPQPPPTTTSLRTPLQVVTSPQHTTSATPYNGYNVPGGQRPTVKRPYLTYVPVTTALRKKKPRPTTSQPPRYEYEITRVPVVLQATIGPTPAKAPPLPPTFVSPQHVQVFHKGESPIMSRPFYYDDARVVVTAAPDYSYNDADANVITSTPRPNYITEGLGKLKDILYTTPRPTQLYPTDDRRKQQYKSPVTTVETVKSIEYTTESPLKYYSDLTRTPIYVKDFDNINSYNRDQTSTTLATTPKLVDIDNNALQPSRQPYRDGKAGGVLRTTTTPAPQSLLDAYQPNRTPKTTYFFYDEPQYAEGYVQDVPPVKQTEYVPQRPPKWQYDAGRPAQRPSYNVISNVKTPEEELLAQIAETLRQPGNNYYYDNSPTKQPSPNNYYTENRQQFYPITKPINGYANSSPRPGFYITKKPNYYQITTPSSYNLNTQGDRDFPYSFEDVIQSTERPPPRLYVSTQRPRYQATRLAGPDITVQTSPKTVYEYSYHQKQPDASSNYVTTERPRLAPSVRQPTPTPQYYSQSATPHTLNQIYQSTTSKPSRKYPKVTPDPLLDNYFTQHDDTVLDDITKKYFTIFGQKLRNDGGFVPITTPLPASRDKTRYPGGQSNNYPAAEVLDNPTQIPLYDDIAVNYHTPRPPVNPDSEFINPHRGQYRGEDDGGDSDGEGGGKLISYKLPGNEGGHFYFVTPQVVKQQQQQQRRDGDAYQYPVPERGLRTRRNKIKQR